MHPQSDVVTRGSEAHRRAELARLYATHLRNVWRWLAVLGVREADLEDAAHDVFVAAYQGLASFEGRSSHKTWLFGVAHHVAIDYRRRPHVRRETIDTPPEQVDGGPDPERVAFVGQARAILDDILEALSEEQRVAFLLYELAGLTGADIAELTGVPLQTVFSRLRAAREHVERRSAKYL